MREFWDRRAREDPYFFVDDRLAYKSPDLERFWAGGNEALDGLLGLVGVAIEPGDRVVEIGCGIGRMTRAIASRGASVVALDVSAEMLARAREHNPDLGAVEWMLGDGVSLRPLVDASFDACVSHVVFQHIPDPAVILGYVGEIGRVLRPGGWAAFQVSNDPDVHRGRTRGSALSRARRRLRVAAGRAPRGQSDPAWLGSAVDLGELRAAAAESGMEVERVVGEGTQFCLVLARRRAARDAG